MADIRFEVHHKFAVPPRQVWNELVHWAGHGKWIPLTRVKVDGGEPAVVGATFTAWTGIGRVALPVERAEHADEVTAGRRSPRADPVGCYAVVRRAKANEPGVTELFPHALTLRVS